MHWVFKRETVRSGATDCCLCEAKIETGQRAQCARQYVRVPTHIHRVCVSKLISHVSCASQIHGTPPPHGLVFDGDVRGTFTGEAVQDLATSYGWTGEELPADNEFYNEAIDEAEDWLNDNVAEDGSVFHFADGSFYYELLSEIEQQ